MSRRTLALPVALACVLVAALGLPSLAEETAAESPDPAAVWTSLQEADYTTWGTFPEREDGLYHGMPPHGAWLKLFVNETAAAAPDELPVGSIVVKESYSKDEVLEAISVMKRIEGFDPEHGDWWYAEYTPDGEVEVRGDEAVAGAPDACWGCHSAAEGNDYVFGNE